MARKRKNFWTYERLKELEGLFVTLSPPQLARHYQKPFTEITAAYEFQLRHKSMKVQTRKSNGMRITIYKAAYAEGATPRGSSWE